MNVNLFAIDATSKVFCLNEHCGNNAKHVCNLKGVSIAENGMCAGIVKIKIRKKKATNDKQ